MLLLRHTAVQWWYSHDALRSSFPSNQDGLWWTRHGSQVLFRNDIINATLGRSLYCPVCAVSTCFCFTLITVSQKSTASLQAVAMDQESFRFCESLPRLTSVMSFSQHVLSLVDAAHLAMEERWELHPLPLPLEMLLTWGRWGSDRNLIWWSQLQPHPGAPLNFLWSQYIEINN